MKSSFLNDFSDEKYPRKFTLENKMEITKDDLFRFNTIEHDMVTIKQHFKNTKFAFLEREAKIYFLESIESNVQLNLVQFFEESKKRLVEVKRSGENIGEKIKELSIENYELKKQINEIHIDYDRLDSLKKKFEGSKSKFQQKEALSRAENEFSEVSDRAKKLVGDLEKLKEEEEKLKLINNPSYLISLNEKVRELERKQKRWSRVRYDQMLVDTFSWYDKMIGIVEMFFGSIGNVTPKKNGFDMEITQKNHLFVISIRNGVFSGVSGTENEQLKKIVEWCVRLDNPRLFALLTRRYLLLK